jgi:branched-chain amino acid transport system substrate-binding protein
MKIGIGSIRVLVPLLCFLLLLGVAFRPAATATSASVPGAPKELKVALVDFLSGPAAKAGTAAIEAGRLIIARLNDAGGIKGVKIRPVVLDEAGGAAKQVTEYRRLVLEEKVDAVLGYLSSADCLAVAPVAEELKTFTIFNGCGTSRLFEEAQYKYVFRAVNYEGSENVAAALYALSIKPDLKTVVGLNQDYAWGRDSWATFIEAIRKLKPDVQVVDVLWPSLGPVEFSAEISKVLAAKPDIIHTSFWAGFLDSFIKQAAPRGLFRQSLVVAIVGERSLLAVGKDVPEGVIIGGRGGYIPYILPNPQAAPEARRFYDDYEARFGEIPIADSFNMVQVILAMKAAYDKATEVHGRWPTREEVIKALEFLEFDSLGIRVSMALGNGHQAIHPQVFGITGPRRHPKWGFPLVEKVKIFPAEKVNPPRGVKHLDWIRSWPEGKGP